MEKEKKCPIGAEDYTLHEEVGTGASSAVVAAKNLELERSNCHLNEYNRGISDWNFNLEDLKAQASLGDDAEKDGDKQSKQLQNPSSSSKHFPLLQHQSSSASQHSDATDSDDNVHTSLSSLDSTTKKSKGERSDDDMRVYGSTIETTTSHTSPGIQSLEEKPASGMNKKSSDGAPTSSNQSSVDKVQNQSQSLSSSVITNLQILDNAHPEIISKGSKTPVNGDEVDEKGKNPVIRQKGRFKVTSENVEMEKVVPAPMLPKSHSVQVISQHPAISSVLPHNVTPTNPLARAFATLQSVLQINIQERDYILGLMKQGAAGDSTDAGYTMMNTAVTEKSLLEAAHDKEKELLNEMTDLQWRLISVQEELQKYRTESTQMNT